MWFCADARRAALAAAVLATAFGCAAAAPDRQVADPAYWLRYGNRPHLCPGAGAPIPSKLVGATWGVLASGVLLCRDLGDAYALEIDYLNVSIDPDDHAMLSQDTLAFDWIGLALYGPAPGGGVDWLFDGARPVKGELRRSATGRIVFGHITFDVPKAAAERAEHMLFYLTFGGPLVSIDAL